ncbi:MAG: helix-turn-helix domain-containing protein [Anaerovoracaceae bacterium]|jgi:DNA-binding CsgD family transcriptional regulator
MNEVSNTIYDFIYIAVIILGGVTLTLAVILNARERDDRHRAILYFVLSMFCYMAADFVTYYCLGENSVASDLVFMMMTISDILFAVLVLAWLYMLVTMMNGLSGIPMKRVVIITLIYLVVSQVLSIRIGRLDSYSLMVESGIEKTVLMVVDATFDIYMMVAGARCLLLLFTKAANNMRRNLLAATAAGLVAYMVWIFIWDYNTWYKTEENLLEIYAVDPLILAYAIMSILLIYYFYKKDPLRLSDSPVAGDRSLDLFAEQYSLTHREREVLELLNNGLSNKQIAAELKISLNTVKRHVNNIFKKSDTQSRHEVIFKISNIK